MRHAHFMRVTLGLVVCLMFAADRSVVAAPVTSASADTAARHWLGRHPQPMASQIGTEVREVKTYAGTDGKPAYYVVALNPEGFLLVAADDLVQPVLGFSATGEFDPDDRSCLKALVTNDANARVTRARLLQKQALAGQALPADAATASARWTALLEAGDATEQGISSVAEVRVAPFTQTKWNQGNECGSNCYNYYSPEHYVCGCVATAMAQTMRFHQYPTTGVGTASFLTSVCNSYSFRSLRGGDGSGGAYDWANMPLDPGCSTTDVQRQAIGALCYDAGVSVGMDWCSDGSGADTLSAATQLKSTFGYSNAVKGYRSGSNIGDGLNGMVNPNLDAGFPVILGITGDGGHAIVADGYGYDSNLIYHHLNMGWGGSSNIWYNLPDILDFDSVYKCVYNIYVTGTGEIISGRVLVNGTPISGATVTATKSGGGVYTATTDSRGIYALPKVPSNSSYTVAVTAEGYTFTDQTTATGKSSNSQSSSGNVWGLDFAGAIFDPCPLMYGDIDYDNDVDQEDFGAFQLCLTGSVVEPLSQTCTCLDRDKNGIVNSADLATFITCMTGAGNPANPPVLRPECAR